MRGSLWLGAAAGCLLLVTPVPSPALIRWSGDLTSEYSAADNNIDRTYLLQSYFGITARPPRKRLLDTRLNLRLSYFDANGDTRFDTNPLGTVGFRVAGDGFQLDAQQLRSASLTTLGQLINNRTRRVSLSIGPSDWPRLFATFNQYETSLSSHSKQRNHTWTVTIDHTAGPLYLHAGYYRQVQNPGVTDERSSDNTRVGATYQRSIARTTRMNLAIDLDRHTTSTSDRLDTIGDLRTMRIGLTSRPRTWMLLDFSLLDERTETRKGPGGTYWSRNYDLTGSLYPWPSTRLYSTVGNRGFDDDFAQRDVDYVIVGSTWTTELTRSASFSLSASHTTESDPRRGTNQRDYGALNSDLYVSPRMRAHLNLSTTHNSSPGFIDPARYDGAGDFTGRNAFDDSFAGFTYYATDLGQVFTKRSAAFADWSEGVFVEIPTVRQYRNSLTLQIDAVPSQKSRLSLHYSLDTQADRLRLGGDASQTWSGSLSYQATRRAGFTMTGVRSSSAFGSSRSSWTATLNTTTIRRHRLSLSYGSRGSSGSGGRQAALTLSLMLPRGSQLDLIGSVREPLSSRADSFWRARYVNTF